MLYRENYTTSKQKISNPKSFQQFLTWEKTTRDTIDFKKTYVDMADDLIAGLMLSQIVYWHLPDKDGNTKLRVQKDGKQWLAKKYDDWYKEVRINHHQARYALNKLEKKELVETRVYKFNGSPTKHIRIRTEQFLKSWSDQVNKRTLGENDAENVPQQNPIPTGSGNIPNSKCEYSQMETPDIPNSLTETTSKNTSKNVDTNVSSNEVRRKDSEESANAVSHSEDSEFSNPKQSFSELLELFEKNHSNWNKSNGHLKALLDIFGLDFSFARIGQIRKKYSDELITEALKRLRSANKSSTEIGSVEKYLFGILERMQKESESQPLSSGKEDYQWPDNLPDDLPQNPACWTAEQQSLYQPPPYETENYNRFWDLVEGKEDAP